MKYSKAQLERLERGVCTRCGAESNGKTLCPDHMKIVTAQSKVWATQLKKEVFDHYGNACACCGETIPQFLTIDHINSNIDRELCGPTLYARIRRENYPTDFRILCWNCNCGRRRGPCPHETVP